MTRTGPAKQVDDEFWKGRLDNARAFKDAAHDGAALATPGDNANPLMSHIVHATIAYADALTAKAKLLVNQHDHKALGKTLRAALGNELPTAQERRVGRIVSEKDQVQYGARGGQLTHALDMLKELDAFAEWAEDSLNA